MEFGFPYPRYLEGSRDDSSKMVGYAWKQFRLWPHHELLTSPDPPHSKFSSDKENTRGVQSHAVHCNPGSPVAPPPALPALNALLDLLLLVKCILITAAHTGRAPSLNSLLLVM